MGRESEEFQRRKRINLSRLPNLILTVLVCLVCWTVGYQYSVGYPVVCDTARQAFHLPDRMLADLFARFYYTANQFFVRYRSRKDAVAFSFFSTFCQH